MSAGGGVEAPLPVLYSDDHLLAVDKPAALAVHRSRLVGSDSDYLIDRLRAQAGGPVQLVHRLDRATSGIVLVARNAEIAADLGRQLMARSVEKRYLAVCRGWPETTGQVDYPLPGVRESGPRKPALTRWQRLATVEVPIAISRYPCQRYALVEIVPETGRYRQIRRHFSHIHHPLIGDTSHGRGEHNRLFREHFQSHRLLLHAWRLRLRHPVGGHPLELHAPLDAGWLRLLDRFGWPSPDTSGQADAGADPR
ncbi:pseudouridine synthase [Dokdonella koreensis]|uniref:tRNA pseudouridine synthase C n=1 Tax=Dokdonella koreensis DS-123 TaxID=1300342 RepID=A0A167HAP9_9GAMM|nr:pseudouridine synthase [Dokdonella koreensis]ANB19745.1 tRNA pseudouridine synthase C [Dokdonella koreensis DS-123]